ncbi:hypothetical protein CG716_13650 [Mycolicibacterium sphagni]|uniref:Uncharacterized protein n=1 Tax=Mycolicibacterium sphagni TaxID=1786 RepID=A0A255DHM7_9MYCO|nr:hypothetical protein CG716_13650 [Mycolicibacterium sphagni]
MTTAHLSEPDYQDEYLADSLCRARAGEAELRSIDTLRDVGKRLLVEAERLRCDAIVPVDMLAQSITTSAQLLSDHDHDLPFGGSSAAVHRALVVAAVTVTGSLCTQEAAALRAAGAKWVGLVVYQRTRPDLDGLDQNPLFDRIVSIGPI